MSEQTTKSPQLCPESLPHGKHAYGGIRFTLRDFLTTKDLSALEKVKSEIRKNYFKSLIKK